MLFTFFKIRCLQALRIVQDIGTVRLVLFCICLLPFLFRYFAEAWYLSVVASLFLLLIHLARTDKKFLKILHCRPLQVYAVDYGLFLLFPLAWLLYVGAYWHFLAVFGFALGLIFLPFTLPQFNQPLLLFSNIWIPAIAFEWKSGFRQYFTFVMVLWASGFGLCQYEVAIPLLISALTLLSSCFYLACEPLPMLLVFGKTPKQLLQHKIYWQLLLFWGFISPLVVLFLVFHLQYWYLMLYFLVSSSLAQIFAILYKYTVYRPATQATLNLFIYVLFGSIFLFILILPLFVPVGIFVLVRYYRKAVQNLETFISLKK